MIILTKMIHLAEEGGAISDKSIQHPSYSFL